MVERLLAMQKVEGSNPLFRSKLNCRGSSGVERILGKDEVEGPNPSLGSSKCGSSSEVERWLPKPKVAGPSPVFRSKLYYESRSMIFAVEEDAMDLKRRRC